MRGTWARPGEALARRGVSGGTRRKVGADAVHIAEIDDEVDRVRPRAVDGHDPGALRGGVAAILVKADFPQQAVRALRDRKSTRLNSSHVRISYAVFCLKKKKKNI